jgi:protein TonB
MIRWGKFLPDFFYGIFKTSFLYSKLILMESGKILQSDYLDLVFDNRNKQYGGYELRKHYNRRALKALGVTCFAIVLSIGVPTILGKLNAKEPVIAEAKHERDVLVTTTNIDFPKPRIKPPKPVEGIAAPERTAATIKNPVPKIVPNEKVTPDVKPPDTKELENKLSGPVNNPGEEGEVIAMTDKPHKGPYGNGTGPGKEKEGGTTESNNKPIVIAEEMPEFPGGAKALAAFIRDNLRYPLAAREEEIEGKVIITFVVNAQGAIEGAEVRRGIGGGCDKEALRVVNAMPKWKPGRQQGKPVKVYFTLPISFRLES